jgi:hypothetical protein
VFGREELERQTREIARDKENLHVRRVCIFLPATRCVPPGQLTGLHNYGGVESLTQ